MAVDRHVAAISAVIGLLALFFFFSTPKFRDSPAPIPSHLAPGRPHQQSGSCAVGPYVPGWSAWFNPTAWIENNSTAGEGDGLVDCDWNILYHLGGYGPWIENAHGVVDGGVGPPDGCRIEQVHMLSRHGERYPTVSSGNQMISVIDKIISYRSTPHSSLAFLTNWTFFTSNTGADLEQLTTTGPYAGTLGQYTTGTRLRTRYPTLLSSLPLTRKLKIWASDSPRVVASAHYFAAGLFGLEKDDKVDVEVVPETADRGGDTLTPGDTCRAYGEDDEHGHDQGGKMLDAFVAVYLEEAAERLSGQLLGGDAVRVTPEDVFTLQQICGFETIVRGKSPWCGVFTREEWLGFEYARDLLHFYRSGPGNKWGKVMGGLWLNATADILAQGPEAGPLFLSFTHDGDMVPVFATLDLLHDGNLLSAIEIDKKRRWRMTQVVPMGGRLIIERMSCTVGSNPRSWGQSKQEEVFVRLNINDGIVAMPNCQSGPGQSCPLKKFLEAVSEKVERAGSFNEKCGLEKDAPRRITFLKQGV